MKNHNPKEKASKFFNSIRNSIENLDFYLSILPDYADQFAPEQQMKLGELLKKLNITTHIFEDYLMIPSSKRKHFEISEIDSKEMDRVFELLIKQKNNNKFELEIIEQKKS